MLPRSSGWREDRAIRVHLGLQHTPPSPAWADVPTIVGTWLSLVERTLGVGEVASSNLVVPTIFLSIYFRVVLKKISLRNL